MPVVSAKPIARVPMLSDVGGGHSWAVEKSPLGVLETGVQARVSFGPPLHFIVVASQIGQGWMKVVQIPPGQSALVMQPLPSFVPPEQAPVSHVAAMLQSTSEQQTAPLSVHRPLSLTHVPPGQEPGVTVPQPPPAAQFAPGVVPPTHRIGRRSPAR